MSIVVSSTLDNSNLLHISFKFSMILCLPLLPSRGDYGATPPPLYVIVEKRLKEETIILFPKFIFNWDAYWLYLSIHDLLFVTNSKGVRDK